MALITMLVSTAAFAFVDPTALAYDSRHEPGAVAPTTEMHCLALNIYHEARGETVGGKFAVGQVTMNRVHDSHYPRTICGVVWQRGQFSWTRDGRPDRPYDREAWKEALWVATTILHFNPLDVVGRAIHYHAVYVRPYWAASHRRVRRIGRHIFYEPPDRSWRGSHVARVGAVARHHQSSSSGKNDVGQSR